MMKTDLSIKKETKATLIYNETNVLGKHLWNFKEILDKKDYPKKDERINIDENGKIWSKKEIEEKAICPFLYAIYYWNDDFGYVYTRFGEKKPTKYMEDYFNALELDSFEFPKTEDEIWIDHNGKRLSKSEVDYGYHHYEHYFFALYKWEDGKYKRIEYLI